MKQEFKWYVTIRIEVEDTPDDDNEGAFDTASEVYDAAKNAFFDCIAGHFHADTIVDYDILDQEDK